MTTEGGDAPNNLGPLERRVMAQLWARGPQSVGDVLEALNAGEAHALAYTTVMTILVRLHKKGYLSREREGRLFRYSPAFPESALQAEIGRRELSRLIDRYGVDSVAGFAADLGERGLVRRLRAMARSGSGDG